MTWPKFGATPYKVAKIPKAILCHFGEKLWSSLYVIVVKEYSTYNYYSHVSQPTTTVKHQHNFKTLTKHLKLTSSTKYKYEHHITDYMFYFTLDSNSIYFIQRSSMQQIHSTLYVGKYFYILQMKWVLDVFIGLLSKPTYVNKTTAINNTSFIQQNTYKPWTSISKFPKHSWKAFSDTMSTLTGLPTLTIDQSGVTQYYE